MNMSEGTFSEALPGVWRNREIRLFISGEQGNKGLKPKGTGEQRQFWGTGNIVNQDFYFGEQGKMPIFQGNKGTGTFTPKPLGGPYVSAQIIYCTDNRDFLHTR